MPQLKEPETRKTKMNGQATNSNAIKTYKKRKNKQPCFEMENKEKSKNDAVKSPDDTTLKTRATEEIYPKLIAFEQATKDYKLPINWKNVKILIKKHDENIREIKNNTRKIQSNTICQENRATGTTNNSRKHNYGSCTGKAEQIKRRMENN